MKYFKSYYEKGITYPKGWYGTLDFAPPVNILMYNDAEGYCIGTIGNIVRKKSVITSFEKELYEKEHNPTNIRYEIVDKEVVRIEDDLVAIETLDEYNNAIRVINRYVEDFSTLIEELPKPDVKVQIKTIVSVSEMIAEKKTKNPKGYKYEYLGGIDGGGHRYILTEDVEELDGIEYIDVNIAKEYLKLVGENIWSGKELEDRWCVVDG